MVTFIRYDCQNDIYSLICSYGFENHMGRQMAQHVLGLAFKPEPWVETLEIHVIEAEN